MIPEAAYAMLACARLGAVHSIVFGGFSPDSLAGRIEGCNSKVIITADEGLRGGRKVALKVNADEACNKTGFVCQDTTTALECRGGAWVALACRGSGGCAEADGNIQCDMTGNLAGDACASTAEGKGLCSADGKATLECRSGALVATNACSSCTVSADQVVCNQ
jgi:hypothetical protein